MNLESYCVDGRIFRTGSASGLKHQDNDLVLVEDAGLCARFMAVWRSADAEQTCKTAL